MTAGEYHYIDEIIEVLKAAKRGEQIEQRDKDNRHLGWSECTFPNWDFYRVDFRGKPKPREFIVELCMDGSLNLYRGDPAQLTRGGEILTLVEKT